MIKLATHQDKAQDIIETYLNLGYKRILIVSPTGSGKTVMFGNFLSKAESEQKKSVVLTDRINLLSQTLKRFLDQFGITASLVQSKGGIATTGNDGSPILTFVAMVETLFNKLELELWQSFFSDSDYMIIDEAHEQRFSKLINHKSFIKTAVIGFTATSVYSSTKRKMSDDYDVMIQIASENELIEDGRLVMPKTIANDIDVSNIKKKRGEYTDESQLSVLDEFIPPSRVVEIYEQCCLDYIEEMRQIGNPYADEYEGKNLKAIYFGVNSAHCLDLYGAFRERGIKAGFILSDSKLQKQSERDFTEKQFENNEIEVLINCQIATKGYDVSDILIVGKVFLTASLAKDNQTSGRGSRPLVDGLHFIDSAKGRRDAILKSKKPFFFIIDYLSNWEKHGTWNSYKDWRHYFEGKHLSKKKNADLESGRECPKCGNTIAPNLKVCDSMILNVENGNVEACGYKFPTNDPAKKVEKEGGYSVVNEEEFKLEYKDLLNKDVFERLDIYKAKRCSLKDALKRLSNEDKCIFAVLMGYKVFSWWHRYYRQEPPKELEENAVKRMLDITYQKVSQKEPEAVERMMPEIFKNEDIIENSYKVLRMFA